MGKFVGIESSYISKDGCRMVWEGIDEDDSDVVVLNKEELDSLTEILSKNSAGKVELEDEFSTILINTDIVQFRLKDGKYLEVKTDLITKAVLEYKKVPHIPKPIKIYSKEFFPSIQIESQDSDQLKAVLKTKNGISEYDLFRIMATRRSTRNFDSSRIVEQWKVDKILAAADTAPTAGNFQGFEVEQGIE